MKIKEYLLKFRLVKHYLAGDTTKCFNAARCKNEQEELTAVLANIDSGTCWVTARVFHFWFFISNGCVIVRNWKTGHVPDEAINEITGLSMWRTSDQIMTRRLTAPNRRTNNIRCDSSSLHECMSRSPSRWFEETVSTGTVSNWLNQLPSPWTITKRSLLILSMVFTGFSTVQANPTRKKPPCRPALLITGCLIRTLPCAITPQLRHCLLL